MASTDSVPDEPDPDRPTVPDEPDTWRPPPDEREVVVNRILDTGHGPFIEPRPGVDGGDGWVGEQIRAAAARAFAAGVRTASASDSLEAAQAVEEYVELRKSVWRLALHALHGDDYDPGKPRPNPPKRVFANTAISPSQPNWFRGADWDDSIEENRQRLEARNVGTLLQADTYEPDHIAPLGADDAQWRVESAFAAGIRSVTADNHRAAVETVRSFAELHGGGLTKSFVKIASHGADITPETSAGTVDSTDGETVGAEHSETA